MLGLCVEQSPAKEKHRQSYDITAAINSFAAFLKQSSRQSQTQANYIRIELHFYKLLQQKEPQEKRDEQDSVQQHSN